MAAFSLQNARIFMAGADLTGYSNQIDLSAEVDDLDATTFASGGFKEHAPGLRDAKAQVQGFWDAGDLTKPDDNFFAALGAAVPLSFCPTAGAVGDISYAMNTTELGYTFGGKVGDLLPVSMNAAAKGSGLVRGVFAHPAGTARTATGNGTSLNLGAVGATQRVHASLHVLSVAGTSTPTITCKVQSATGTSFTSPNDRITFDAFTAIGGEWKYLAGPITDTWWRVQWTISGTSPSFLFAATIGIA